MMPKIQRRKTLYLAGLLAAVLLYAPPGSSQQKKTTLDDIAASLEPRASGTPAPKDPFDQVLETLEDSKGSIPAGAATHAAAPTATPDHLGDRLQDIGATAAQLLQRQAELQREIGEMKRETTTGQRHFDVFMRQMGTHKVAYTASQLKWINSLEQSVASQTADHLKELDRRLSHLERQQQVLQNCGGRPRHANPKHAEKRDQKVETLERCDRDVPEIARYLSRLSSILKAEHSKMTRTYETAEEQMKATEAANVSKQRPSSPFER